MVFSLNRGMFLSLGFGIFYVAVRLALRGRLASLGSLLGVVCCWSLRSWSLTPLGHLVVASFASSNHGHSDTTRLSASQQALAGARQSPIFGYGEPTPVTGQGSAAAHRYPGSAVDGAVLERRSGSDLFHRILCRGAVADAPGARHGGTLAAHRPAGGPAADRRLRLAAGRVAGRDGRLLRLPTVICWQPAALPGTAAPRTYSAARRAGRTSSRRSRAARRSAGRAIGEPSGRAVGGLAIDGQVARGSMVNLVAMVSGAVLTFALTVLVSRWLQPRALVRSSSSSRCSRSRRIRGTRCRYRSDALDIAGPRGRRPEPGPQDRAVSRCCQWR